MATAALQAQIAALQAQLQELYAQQGLGPAPTPPFGEEAGYDPETQELLAQQGLGPAPDPEVEPLYTEQSMPEAVERSLAELQVEPAERRATRKATREQESDPDFVGPPSPYTQRQTALREDFAERGSKQEARGYDAQMSEQIEALRAQGHDDASIQATLFGMGEGEGAEAPAPSTLEFTPEEAEAMQHKRAPAEAEGEGAPQPVIMPEGLFDDEAPAEAPAEAPDQALLEQLFFDAHGGPFDPVSSMDAGKMEAIQELLASGQDFGDLVNDEEARTRFALQLYRQ